MLSVVFNLSKYSIRYISKFFAVTCSYKGVILEGAFDQCHLYANNQWKVGIFASMLVIVFFANSFISYNRPMYKFNLILSMVPSLVIYFFQFQKYMKMKMMIPVINIFSIA